MKKSAGRIPLALVLFVIGLTVRLVAEPPKKAEAPRVPLDVESAFYFADGRVAHMEKEWAAANAELQKAAEAVRAVCGKDFVPAQNGSHLSCVEPAAAPSKSTTTKPAPAK